jgi:hypothetical protein
MKKVKQEHRLLVAGRTKDIPRLTTKTVERTRKNLSNERLKSAIGARSKRQRGGWSRP